MSSESFYESALARGLLLKEQGRFAEAENYFRRALSADPENSEALNFLANCQFQQGRSGEALHTINDAIAREPNESDYHALQAIILAVLDRPQDALAAAMRGLALEPNSVYALNALTQTYLSQAKWPQAEAAARKALAADADSSVAANFLALSLRMQGKWEENAEQIRGLLSRDPEDAFTHSNAGWSALTQGDSKKAELHFREALRLDTDNESARTGLLHAFKGRSWLYRRFLDYGLFMEKYSGSTRLQIVAGLMLAVNLLKSLLLSGPLALLGGLLVVAYASFVLFSHVARVVGNLFLLTDRFASYVLHPEEKTEARAVGAALGVGIALAIAAVFLPPTGHLFLAAMLVGGTSIPLCHVFTNDSRRGAMLFASIAGFAYLAALVCLAGAVTGIPSDAVVGTVAVVAILVLVVSTWLANVSRLRA